VEALVFLLVRNSLAVQLMSGIILEEASVARNHHAKTSWNKAERRRIKGK
jgi:hypothetical protein